MTIAGCCNPTTFFMFYEKNAALNLQAKQLLCFSYFLLFFIPGPVAGKVVVKQPLPQAPCFERKQR
jgi:hypothetical protein